MNKFKDAATRAWLIAKDYFDRYPVATSFVAGFILGAVFL